jgi:hypothetical protein
MMLFCLLGDLHHVLAILFSVIPVVHTAIIIIIIGQIWITLFFSRFWALGLHSLLNSFPLDSLLFLGCHFIEILFKLSFIIFLLLYGFIFLFLFVSCFFFGAIWILTSPIGYLLLAKNWIIYILLWLNCS